MSNPLQNIQVDGNDLIQALRDQREGALDAVATLNAQVAQMKRVIEFQGARMVVMTNEIERLKAFEPPAQSTVDQISQKISDNIDGKTSSDPNVKKGLH